MRRAEPELVSAPTSRGPSSSPDPPPPAARRGGHLWGWLVVLSPWMLLAHMRGAPLGEPTADDYDFLRNALLLPVSWFDGGGLVAYWRPLARQAYYGLLGPVMLEHPVVVALIHTVLLSLAAWFLYRALRARWPAPLAAAVASFPMIAEGNRVMVAWPSHFQDVGVILFSALALHEASRRRLPSALASLLAALLCKEIAVVTAVLLPWMPDLAPGPRRTRLRWSAAALGTVAAWGAVYAWVMQHTDVHFASQLTPDSPLASVTTVERLGWAVQLSLGNTFGVTGVPHALRLGYGVALGILGMGALATGLATPVARARLRRAAPWMAWGLVWWMGATAMLTQIFPHWAPSRSGFGMIGIGAAAVAGLAAAHPGFVAALVALRLAAFWLSPGPPTRLELDVPATGGEFYLTQLVRMQHMSVQMRRALAAGLPRLPRHARVVQHHFPRLTESTFIARTALQVWYRDTTLEWMTFSHFREDPRQPVAGFLEYEPHREMQMAVVNADAMRALLSAIEDMRKGRVNESLARLSQAETLQPDSNAAVFLSTVTGKRAVIHLDRGMLDAAEHEANRTLARWPANADGLFVLAEVCMRQKRIEEARLLVERLLQLYPEDPGGHALLQRLTSGDAAP